MSVGLALIKKRADWRDFFGGARRELGAVRCLRLVRGFRG